MLTVPSITGKTLGTNGNDFFALNFWTSAGSDYNARSNSLGLQTIGVDLWGVHIKVGTHTTAATDLYKQPELGPELARCQRYYQSFGGSSAYQRFGLGQAINTTQAYIFVNLPTTMRANPSFSSATQLCLLGSGGNVLNLTAFNGDSDSPSSFNFVATVASGLVAGSATQLLANSSFTARVIFDAEL